MISNEGTFINIYTKLYVGSVYIKYHGKNTATLVKSLKMY